jgi:hypothetical protein
MEGWKNGGVEVEGWEDWWRKAFEPISKCGALSVFHVDPSILPPFHSSMCYLRCGAQRRQVLV